MRTSSVLGILLACVSCTSSGGHGGASIDGTIHGRTFSVNGAISAVVAQGATSSAAIFMNDQPSLCDDLGSDKQPPNMIGGTILLFQETSGSAATAPTAPGTYAIFNGSGQPASTDVAEFNAVYTDETCADVTANEAGGMTGTVTLTSVTGTMLDGHYDITLDSGDHIIGTFSPEACPAFGTVASSMTAPVCI